MIVATHNNWLLEIGQRADGWTAWVSDASRYVIGFGRGATSRDAARKALTDAAHHYRASLDRIAGLEVAYFGPSGMIGGELVFRR